MNMAPKLQQAPIPQPGRIPSPAVDGLDAGRDLARVQFRRKRRRDRIRNVFIAVIVLAVLGGFGYAGYIAYGDFADDEEVERQEIRAELDAENPRSGDDLRDAIDTLETEPKFNGPGVPGLGVGDEP
jgi:hypothetical protein